MGTRSESPALIVYGTGHVKVIPVGAAYEITTLAAFHCAGDRVRETVEGGWTYILNDAPSVRVDAVYLFGKRVLEPMITPRPPVTLGGGVVGVLGSEGLGEEDPPLLENDWIPVAPELCSVDLCDTTTFPELGRAVTSVTFRSDPTALPGYSVAGADLRADISGVDSEGDGTGTLVENPAEVIRTILPA